MKKQNTSPRDWYAQEYDVEYQELKEQKQRRKNKFDRKRRSSYDDDYYDDGWN